MSKLKRFITPLLILFNSIAFSAELWSVPLGDTTYGTPLVAEGCVFIATNNKGGRNSKHPSSVDLGVLLAFDAVTGRFLWQYSVQKLPNEANDWPWQGICSTPARENGNLWLVNNRCEIVCLPIKQETQDAQPIWSFDMIKELDVLPHHATSCSPIVYGDFIFSGTSNGIDAQEKSVPKPNAPSFVALDKNSGEIVWHNNAPGAKILDGQWASPAFVAPNTILFPAGDGFLYAVSVFEKGISRHWKYDCNPKDSIWKSNMSGDRNFLLAKPLVVDNRIYIATGRDPEAGDGSAVFHALDISKIDFPATNEYVDVTDKISDWIYKGRDVLAKKSKNYEDVFHRTIASAAFCNGLILIGDHAGIVHCLDAENGQLYWTHDMLGAVWSGALAHNGQFILGSASGDVVVFEASKKLKILKTVSLGEAIYSTPVFANGRLYIATTRRLVCLTL